MRQFAKEAAKQPISSAQHQWCNYLPKPPPDCHRTNFFPKRSLHHVFPVLTHTGQSRVSPAKNIGERLNSWRVWPGNGGRERMGEPRERSICLWMMLPGRWRLFYRLRLQLLCRLLALSLSARIHLMMVPSLSIYLSYPSIRLCDCYSVYLQGNSWKERAKKRKKQKWLEQESRWKDRSRQFGFQDYFHSECKEMKWKRIKMPFLRVISPIFAALPHFEKHYSSPSCSKANTKKVWYWEKDKEGYLGSECEIECFPNNLSQFCFRFSSTKPEWAQIKVPHFPLKFRAFSDGILRVFTL